MTVKIPDGLPWFLSGVRFKMNGGNWQSINRYDENKKQDENIALVGYDTRTGGGRTDALYIVHAANSYPALVEALKFYTGDYDPALREPNKGPWGINSDDFGSVARAALRAAGEEP